MGGEFCFFTDPAALGTQVADEAFGPALPTTGPPKDRFRVTDRHQPTGSAVAKAYAVCRGQICLQAVGTTLNLILRPLIQPPFDFPYVEYFIYRGIRADSLLASDGQLDLGKEGAGATLNNLIANIREKVLKQAAPQTTKVTAAHLGLDRNHDPASPAVNGGSWGDGQPLDHLFRYPGAAEIPIVEAGWTLGEFGGTIGFEVVVQHYGAQPRIGWARSADAWIEADPIATGASAAASYASRLQREAIGCFVDPCAFWGMFWSDGLTMPGNGMEKGSSLHALLFAPGIFANRNRVYLDVRNEVGLSYDFYGTYQDSNGDGLETGSGPLSLSAKPYPIAGWPIHFHDSSSDRKLCFRLRRDGSSHTSLLFLRQAGRTVSQAERLRDIDRPLGANWTKTVTFRRPGQPGELPPWWFTVHYLRGPAGMAAPIPAAGVFDTSPLQFGPIGDRVVAAYRQMWPGGTAIPPAAAGYQREFVTDKVLRYDGSLKVDPTDPANPRRSLSYDRVGETHYVFQKGVGTDAGKDSVIVVQRRGFKGRQKPTGTWSQSNRVKISSSGGALLFNALAGKVLAAPVSITLNPGAITVPSFLELRGDTPLKAELFDFTILLLSKAAFEAAISAAAATGPPSAPGEKHPIFLSLGPAATVPNQAAAYVLGWRGWDGQNVTVSASEVPIHSADGVFFASADYDRASLAASSSYVLTHEERNASAFWDDFIAKDQGGVAAATRMPGLVSAFGDAVFATDAAPASAPEAALAALVEQYGVAIWDRAVAMSRDPALEEWSDRALYCARAKMAVTLGNHPFLLGNAQNAADLRDRFEHLSRNFAGLVFANGAPSDARIILTGFDPYENKARNSNPSGRLVLSLSGIRYLTAGGSEFKHTNTCIFPNRWLDFDNLIVEKTILAALPRHIQLVCTSSLDPAIKERIVGSHFRGGYIPGLGMSELHLRIDRFAAGTRDKTAPDNDGKVPTTFPVNLNTDNYRFYDTQLKIIQGGNPADLASLPYSQLVIKVKYNRFYRYIDSNNLFNPPVPQTSTEKSNEMVGMLESVPSTAPQGLIRSSSAPRAAAGSGGAFLSNESFYRVSNLVQSTTNPALALWNTVKNGHLHVPELGKYYQVTSTADSGAYIGEVKLADLQASVLAVIDGVLGP